MTFKIMGLIISSEFLIFLLSLLTVVFFALWIISLQQKKKLIKENIELQIYRGTNNHIQEFTHNIRYITLENLKEQQSELTTYQKETLSNQITPLKDQLKEFKESMDRIRDNSIQTHTELKLKMEDMSRLNETLAKEAKDLTNALKGNNKNFGDWGEMQLKSLLEITGLKEYIDFNLQQKINDSIPDCIINLPENRRLIIDAKVSLHDYINYVNEKDLEKRKSFFDKHINSLKRHIKNLSSKEYHKLLQNNSLDYVIMFIPNEQSYIDVLKQEPEFYTNAYKNNIAIATPSSLLPILRTIENLWNIQKRSESSNEIAQLGGKIYDKLAGVMNNMDRTKTNIQKAQDSFNEAYKQIFSERSDSLSGMANKMKEMGIVTSKQITLLDQDIT